MNEYFQKIKEILKKSINYIKASNIKKKILGSNIVSEGTVGLEGNLIDADIIAIVLQDMSVINKLHNDKTLLYYVSLLKEDDQLNFLNNHINMFNEEVNDVYEMALRNISIEKLLKTELGTRVIDAFPRECYEKIKTLDNDKLQEINNQRDTQISLYDISKKIFQNEKGEWDYQKKQDFLNENIDVEHKIAVLKEKGIVVYMSEIINSTMNDNDKIELINNLNISTSVDNLITLDISDKLKSFLIERITESDYRNFINDTFPEKQEKLTYYKFEKIIRSVSVLGKERITEYLSESQKQTYCLVTELFNNFDENQIQALLTSAHNDQFLEMNFLEKNPTINNNNFAIKNLIEINNEDQGLLGFRKYSDFRENNNGLDFCESLYRSLYEYKKYGKLYNEIIKNFQELSEEERADFKDKWNDLMNLDNKFGIQNIQDFQRMDEIEKEYYTKILKESNSNFKIKQAISEILVRNGSIDNIAKLGNGTEYSMKNKSLEDVVDLLTTINEITDQEVLKGILNDCIEMIGSEELKRIRKIGRNIEEKIIQEYREGYTNSFTNYDDMSDEELAKIEGINVQRINGIRIIELMGANFSFLSHSGGITGRHVRCCCTQITGENFSTFGDGLNGYTHIYSRFSPNRIKYVNLGDAGCSDYKNTYISSNDLPSTTQSSILGTFNEVTIATRKEKGDDGLKTTTIMTNKKTNSAEFNKMLENLSDTDSIPQTIYVLHEDVYDKKKEQDELEKEERLRKYLKTLDPKLLNLVLRSTGGTKQSMNLLMNEIKKHIRVHIDSHIGKSTLRRNITRYWQLSRRKSGTFELPYDIMEELEKELEQMDNELLVQHSIKDKVKEVSDRYEDEH